MEKIDHVNKIQRLLRKTWRYTLQESVDIFKECQVDLQKEIDIKIAKEKEKEDAIIIRILKRKEENEKNEAEKRRKRGYKISRFKKPLPEPEDRNQYVRFCRKCKTYYKTFSKYGRICDKCKIKGIPDGVPKELQNIRYKRKEELK